jgi:LacI family transcriptional regulator
MVVSTLHDVAKMAGVSISTVSRILNGTAKVSNDKRLAVEQAVEKLDFRLNLSARGLKTGNTLTFGILIQDVESAYFTRLMKGIEVGLDGSGYVPFIVSGHWNPTDELQSISLLVSRKVDGLIVVSGHVSDAQLAQFARRQPVVVVGRNVEAPGLRSFRVDQVNGAYLATRHLLDLGHTRIGFIGGPSSQDDAVDRRLGYMRAMQEAGLAPNPAWIQDGGFVETMGQAAMERLLDIAPTLTAVFAANDQSAYGARMALYRRNLNVPQDMSLVGLDDLPASLNATPPLTTVRQPIFESGMYAAQTLLQMVGMTIAPELLAPEPPPMRLVVRETTAPPALSAAA